MEVKIIKFDNCKNISEDVHDEFGWILLYGNVTIKAGRDENRKCLNINCVNEDRAMHFCCLSCLIEYLYFGGSDVNKQDVINNVSKKFTDNQNRKKSILLLEYIVYLVGKLKNGEY